jgi:ADP-heptose:LPS heptosyltransferase
MNLSARIKNWILGLFHRNTKKRLLIFSNVKYPQEQKIQTLKTDILCFLNLATSAEYYKNDPVEKILCWHRTQHKDFGSKLKYAENHYMGAEVPHEFVKKLEDGYNWHYNPRPSRNKCLTTGYIIVNYLAELYPDREIVLVNFGMDIPGSTRRSSDHNWKFEAEQFAKFKHIYTADAKNFRKRKIFIIPTAWLGDNVFASAVIHNIAATGLFDINVEQRNRKVIWENCPWLNPEVTRENADNVFRMRMRDRWTIRCRHLIVGHTAEFAGYIGEKIPCTYKKPEIYADIPQERLIEKPYVIINTGWQRSAATKKWSMSYWQKLVELCPDYTFVQIGMTKNNAIPIQADNVINLIDKTDFVQLCQLARDAACIISPPSGILHLAGAYDTQYISLAGGREPVGLVKYKNCHAISSIKKLPCCRRGGCHRNNFSGTARVCINFEKINGDRHPTCRCMIMITPAMVMRQLKIIMKKVLSSDAAN